MRRFFGLILGVILACASALAADEYKIDPRHSNVNFSVTHMTVSTVRGRFTDFDGTIAYDDKDVDLPFELVGPVSPPKAKLLPENGTLTINRQDFGVAWNQPFNNGFAVSNDVKIDISVEADLPLAPPGAAK